jgi:vacuolar protein-sorting-associated protein 4
MQNEETERLKASLEGAIVTEKPNVKWEDVAGLEVAK